MIEHAFKFELGFKAKDKITGFEGILVGRTNYLFGCDCYGLAPQVYDHEKSKRGDTEWFDEGRIEIIGEGVKPEDVTTDAPGCDYREHP